MSTKNEKYLVLRGKNKDIYFIQKRLSKEQSKIIGKNFIKKSLETTNLNEAIIKRDEILSDLNKITLNSSEAESVQDEKEKVFENPIKEDFELNNQKIAGIMTEIFERKNSQYIIIGAGINILTAPKIIDYQTCSLKNYKDNLNYENVLINFIESYCNELKMMSNKNYDQILNFFKNKMSHLGSKINILLPNGDIKEGLLKNLNLDGSLLVEFAGIEESIFSGRIINDFN